MKSKPNLFQRASKFAFIPSFAILCIGAATDVRAADLTWQNGGTTDWNTGTNWSGSSAPGSGDNAIINSNTGNIATITTTSTASDVIVGNGGGTTGQVNHTAGTLTTSQWFKVGQNGGTGVYNLTGTGTGGTHTGKSQGSGSIVVGSGGQQLRLGGDGSGVGSGTLNVNTTGTITVTSDIAVGKNSNGTLNMDSGTITKTGGTFIVGEGVTGLMQMSGGTVNNTGEFWVGNNSGGGGTLTMSGGSINQDSWFSIGRNGSTGVVNLSGGTITKTATNSHFVVGDGSFANSTGTLTQSGGAIDLRSQLWIGKGLSANSASTTTGTATISAGTVQVDSWLSIGRDGATGTLTISGTGSVTQGSPGDPFSNVELTNGTTGSATVNLGNGVAGGTLTAMGIVKSGGAGGTSNFNFNGGTLQAGRSNTAFMTGLTTATVGDGGGIIDTNGFDVTIGQNFVQGDTRIGVLRKIGTGTLTLSGTADNSATRFRVDAGTLVLGKTSSGSVHAVGTSGGAVALLITGGTAQLGGSGGDQIYSQSTVNMTGGTFDFAGLSEGFDGLSGTAGTITNSTAATTSTLTLGQNDSTGSPSFAGIIQNGSGTVALVKSGSGTQTLTGANTYSGGTTINSGTMAIGHNTALGSGGVTINDGATLANNSAGALTVANNFTLSGSTAGETFTGSQNLTLTGTIGSAAAVKITKTGASVLTISSDNSNSLAANSIWNVIGGNYNSSTGLYDNVIALNSGRALGNSSGSVLNLDGGTLRFTTDGGTGYASSRTINVLAGGGSIDDGGFAFGEANGGGSVAPNVVITSGATLSLVSTNKLVLSGVLSGTGGAVSKFGAGTLTLSGQNTYTGFTSVNSGSLIVNGDQHLATGAVSVGNAAKLYGAGTIGGATTVSGTLSGGNGAGSIGTLNLSSTLNFSTGSIFEWDIANNGASYDKAIAGGLVSGLGAVFNVVLNGGGGFADPFWDTSRNWTATDLFGATSASVNLADIFSGSNTSFATNPSQGSFSFTSTGGGTNNQLTWSAVPEPTSAFAGLLIAAGLLRRRRDRREISGSAH